MLEIIGLNPAMPTFNDAAVGPISGYLFQFEKALLVLAQLSNSLDFISIEKVDDIASHSSDGTIILSIQAKHSISSSGSSYGDTSHAFWRTIQIWIEKVKAGVYDSKSEFICCSNLRVGEDSLITSFKHDSFAQIIKRIEQLKSEQQVKLDEFKSKDPKSGKSITATLKLIDFALQHPDELKIVQNNFKIHIEGDVKQAFLNAIHMYGTHMTDLQRDNIYHEFNGWIVSGSKGKWKNGNAAEFTKQEFDTKYQLIKGNPIIVDAIFRTRELLGADLDDEINAKMSDLFVRQISDIQRNSELKKQIIKDAIQNFIHADVELQYIVNKGDYTQADFDKFLEQCFEHWQEKYKSIVVKEFADYTADELNQLAIDLFNFIMYEIKISFLGHFEFSTQNKYFYQGCFLKLSNIPRLGWHPEWESKYLS